MGNVTGEAGSANCSYQGRPVDLREEVPPLTSCCILGAMDSRVKAASIACYMGTFRVDREWAAGGSDDGEQHWPHGISLGLDKPDLVEVRAPLPTQVLVTTDDACFPAAGGREAVAEAGAAFSALNGHLDYHEAVYHHGWVLPNRNNIYAFFCRSLNPSGAPRSLFE